MNNQLQDQRSSTNPVHHHREPLHHVHVNPSHHEAELAWLPIQIFIIILLILFATAAFAQAGGGATAFLQRPVGVEAIGLGGAYSSIAADPSAIFWNPAGLAQSTKYRFLSSYAVLQLEQQNNFVGFSIPFQNYFTFGVGWINYSVDAIPRYGDTPVKIGEFSTSDNAFILSAARQVTLSSRGSISFGMSAKYFYSTIAGNPGSGSGLDAGALFKYDRFSLGAVFQNIAGNIRWKGLSRKNDRVPFTFRGGTSYEFGLGSSRASPSFRVSLEGEKTEARNSIFLGGVEAKMELGMPKSSAAVRAGIGNKLLSGGFSFGIMMDKNVSVQVQYAASDDFLTERILHHIGLMLEF